MRFKVFLQYPCGKLFELRIPITDNNITILPDDICYYEAAKAKFEINDLKVLQKEVHEIQGSLQTTSFISLSKKKQAIE